jgi:hypothetical protein
VNRWKLGVRVSVAILLGVVAGTGFSSVTHAVNALVVNTNGTYDFWNYDLYCDQSTLCTTPSGTFDEPITMVFEQKDYYGPQNTSARILTVLQPYNFTDTGERGYQDFKQTGGGPDNYVYDAGPKTGDPCPTGDVDYHIRRYQVPQYDATWGYFVAADTHEDYNDFADCYNTKVFGYQQEAANYITSVFQANGYSLDTAQNFQNSQCACWQGNHYNDFSGTAQVVNMWQ